MVMTDTELGEYDDEQVQMMKENCIVVDENDTIIGNDSKVSCHLGEGKLHRAFSVLLFNSKNELLIQKRAAEKITFPSIWANSCCSHPLFLDDEKKGIDGARVAAKRKMIQELGIDENEIDIQKLNFITRMHYKARADEKWIEHEIDYIFVMKDDLEINPNKNEIETTRYVNQSELNEFFEKAEENGDLIGPWFRLIKEHFIDKIWENISDPGKVRDQRVHNMGEC